MVLRLEKIREDKKKGKLVFRMKESSEVYANAIRRLILEEVPVLAVEDVEIKENSSSLYDEMLALRLGLIPIKTDLKSYRLPVSVDEVEQRSARCTLQLKVKAAKKGYVYAEEAESADPKCRFVHDKMPIVKLLSKQKLDVTMYAVMGQGKQHVKWCPGWAFYRREPVVTVTKVTDPEKVMTRCTDGVFELKGKKLEVVEEKVYSSQLLEYYASLDKGIEVEYSDTILFTVESWGQLGCREILETAAEILIQKTEEMEKLL